MTASNNNPPSGQRIEASEGGQIHDVIQALVTGQVMGDLHIGNVVYTRSALEELNDYLRAAITTYESWMTSAVLPRPHQRTHPYNFLYAYDIVDAPFFFGREAASRALLEKVLSKRLTILHARSGAGKTSLVKAGLAPLLIREEKCLPVFVRTYDDPALALKRKLAPPSLGHPWPELLDKLSLQDFLGLICAHLSRRIQELVVVFDQFEELFTLVPDLGARQRFIEALGACHDDQSLPLRLVLSIRGDYLTDLAELKHRLPHVFHNDYRLEPLQGDEVADAIRLPLERWRPPRTYEPELLKQLLDDLNRSGMEPPHLQIVCTRLYNSLGPTDTTITLAHYDALGGAQGILDDYLTDAIARRREDAPLARAVLDELLSSSGNRIMLPIGELRAALSHHADLSPLEGVLDGLVDERLLRRAEIDGVPRYELAHDYLARALRERIDPEQLERKRIREELQLVVRDWQAYGRLIPSDRLRELEQRRDKLSALDDDTMVCLVLSAAWHDIGIGYWSQRVGEAALQRIVGLVTDEHPQVHLYAVRALGYAGPAELIAELRAILEQTADPDLQSETAQALYRRGDQGIAALIDVLDTTSDRLIFRAVIEMFLRQPHPGAVGSLIRRLEAEQDFDQIILLARTLESHNDVQAIPALVLALVRTKYRLAPQELAPSSWRIYNSPTIEEGDDLRQHIKDLSARIAQLEVQSAIYGIYRDGSITISLSELRQSLEERHRSLDQLPQRAKRRSVRQRIPARRGAD